MHDKKDCKTLGDQINNQLDEQLDNQSDIQLEDQFEDQLNDKVNNQMKADTDHGNLILASYHVSSTSYQWC